MSSRIDATASAAKSGVRALRRSVSQALEQGQARVKDATDVSGRRVDEALSAAEKVLYGVVDEIAQRGRVYTKAGKDRLYEAEAQVFPRPHKPPIAMIMAAVGAGVLLSLLFTKPKNRT
jgi:ElaB/YqjD/DUF883 family membrane-anchored ribosome-binding protein